MKRLLLILLLAGCEQNSNNTYDIVMSCMNTNKSTVQIKLTQEYLESLPPYAALAEQDGHCTLVKQQPEEAAK